MSVLSEDATTHQRGLGFPGGLFGETALIGDISSAEGAGQLVTAGRPDRLEPEDKDLDLTWTKGPRVDQLRYGSWDRYVVDILGWLTRLVQDLPDLTG